MRGHLPLRALLTISDSTADSGRSAWRASTLLFRARCIETRRQLLEWWAEFNYGDRDVPWIKWDTSQPADRQAEAARLAQLAAAITSLSAASIPLDFEVLERDYGLPVDLERLGEAPPALFAQHHLALGIVTVNEARAQLRLPPIPDGDKLVAAPAPPAPGGFPPPGFGGADDEDDEPDAKPEPPADEDEDEPDEDAEELHRLEHLDPVELSARSEAALIDGFTRGTLSRGAEALAGDIDDLVGIVKRSDTPEEVYRQLVEHYANKDTPQEFLDRIERTMVLAAMQGRYSAVRSV